MKAIKLSFLIICLVSLVVGCSFKDITGQDQKGDRQLTILVPNGIESDTLGSEILRVVREASAQLEINHPGVTVNIDTGTLPNEYSNKVMSEFTNQKIPEIIFVEPSLLDKYAEKGVLTDLSVYANHDQISIGDYYEKLIDGSARGGVWLALPFAPDPHVVFYNKDWFDQANLAYPSPDWTWEDFQETAKILKSSRAMSEINRYGGVLIMDLFFLEPIIASRGGSILSPDGKQASGYLDSDVTASAVKFIVDFYKDQKLDEHSFAPTDARSKFLLFAANNTGMLVADAQTIYFALPELGDKLGIASLPSFRDGLRVNPIITNGLSIMEKSDDKQLAWELLKMISFEQNEFSQRFAQFFLVNNPALANSTGQASDPHKKVMLDELNYAIPSVFSQNEYFGNIYGQGNTIREMLNELVNKDGIDEIKDHLSLIAEFIDTVLVNGEAAAAAASAEMMEQ